MTTGRRRERLWLVFTAAGASSHDAKGPIIQRPASGEKVKERAAKGRRRRSSLEEARFPHCTFTSTMVAAIAMGALALQGYAPSSSLAPAAPALRAQRATSPVMLNMQQRVQSAAIGAAFAASVAVGPAFAADPWPYSTLLSKVQADQVAKVRPPSARPNSFWPATRQIPFCLAGEPPREDARTSSPRPLPSFLLQVAFSDDGTKVVAFD